MLGYYIVCANKLVCFSLSHLRFNSTGQGWGPGSSWDGSEPPLLPSLWLHDLPGLHPTQPLWCSLGWGHSSGRPASPPAGQNCCSVSKRKIFFNDQTAFVASTLFCFFSSSLMPGRRIYSVVPLRACTPPLTWQPKAWLRQAWTGTAWR